MACQKEIGHEKGGCLCIQKPFLLPLIAIIVILRKGADGEGCDLNFEHDAGNGKDADKGGWKQEKRHQ